MGSLAEGLKGLDSLKIMHFDFSQTAITSEGLKKLSACLKEITSLEMISLNFAE